MRILHIGKHFPPAVGGMERFIADLVAEQRARGDEVSVLVHSHGGPSHGDPDWLMRCPVWMRVIFAPISPSFPLWLRRAIKAHRPEVLHLHMPNPSVFFALALPSARRIPWIVHWHSDVVPSRLKLGLRLAYPHYRIFERAVLERAECIIVTSREYLRASKPLLPWRHKCHVVPLGVDPSRLRSVAPEEAAGLWKPEGFRILAVGRLTYYKGFETLLRAVIGAPGQQLVIAGEGEERPRLERILAEAGRPPNIRLAGEVDDDTVCRLMATCDVLCLPSLERTEAFGLVLVEAMRYSKPLLASDIEGSGVGMVARDGQNARVVPATRVEAWRDALASLQASAAKRVRMGRLGFERYQREFNIGAVAARIRELYALSMRLAARSGVEEPADPAPAAVPVREPRRAPASDRTLIVIPALNEAEDIGEVIAQVRALDRVDVLVVDDGSTDDTAAIARLGGATVLGAPLWQGAWGAMQTGIRYAVRHGYQGVVTMDADGQHEPEYLPQMLEAAERGADVVIAACPARGSRLRQVAWSYFRMLTGFKLEDLTSGFRYYNARACRLLAGEEATLLDYQDIGVLLLLRRSRLRIAEIAVEMRARRHGASRVFSSWWTVGVYMAETSLLCLARWNPAPRNPHPSKPET